MSRDLIVSYCSSRLAYTNPTDVLVMLRSAAHYCSLAERVLFAEGLPPAVAEECRRLGWRVEPAPGVDPGRGRWARYLHFLHSDPGHWEQVLQLDARDVVLQANPFPELAQLAGDQLGGGLVACSEGFAIGQCAWNRSDQAKLARDLEEYGSFTHWETLNASIVGGTAGGFIEWATHLDWALGRWRTGATEQAVVNRLWRDYSRLWKIADPRAGHFLCVTGHCVAVVGAAPPVAWHQGKLRGPGGRPYAIFHQWDRTTWAEAIRQRWGQPGTTAASDDFDDVPAEL